MVYAFKNGSHIKADAQTAGEMCERLASVGRLTAKDLVEENRPESAPLHGAFEWNDEIAGDKWREHQARHIIGSLIVKAEKKEPVRAFFTIERSDPNYNYIESILESRNATESLLRTALAELEAFKRKYSVLTELAAVFQAIDNIKEGVA